MKRHHFSLAILLLSLIGWSCNLEKEVTIDLPDYEPKFVLECYLEPGKPFQLLLSRSSSYFAPFDTSTADLLENLLVNTAEVTISHAGDRYELDNQLIVDPDNNKIYNYFNEAKVPEDYDNPFELIIGLPDGTNITGETRLLEAVPFDSIVVEFNDETLARILTYFTDTPGQRNYYRRMLHLESLDSIALQDFTFDDRVVEDVVVFGTPYEYKVGETLYNTLFHIDRTYYEFLESVNNAAASNGNPFALPNPINSKLGGTARTVGIFTGLSYTRRRTVIRQ